MNADGSNVRRLTTADGDDTAPAWSPDGSKIVFRSTRDGNFEIYSMNADGTGQTRLTNHSRADTSPSWSPDGSKIVFSRNTGVDLRGLRDERERVGRHAHRDRRLGSGLGLEREDRVHAQPRRGHSSGRSSR